MDAKQYRDNYLRAQIEPIAMFDSGNTDLKVEFSPEHSTHSNISYLWASVTDERTGDSARVLLGVAHRVGTGEYSLTGSTQRFSSLSDAILADKAIAFFFA